MDGARLWIGPGNQIYCDQEHNLDTVASLRKAAEKSTAIKYNYPGGLVQFELVTEGNQMAVRIANTGPTIPPIDRERIFERFYRADPARSGKVEGTGLGLSLAREIVRAHGGELILDASDNRLTRFAAILPIAG